ncbi:hypothetical protein KIH27_15530 [Mycobacterium sp. M1]|uniref:Uncharacterized protein n=1 Tax=Mycolicibacter acidiphilus TaxID=2835306 RepID=A0ABS5RL42_9MYCO|nr:hypothetical protein [Mycolicibacter acidiphilus]MBS9535000.1 hypothetical protein [Mycolicibacter acidiphilus]
MRHAMRLGALVAALGAGVAIAAASAGAAPYSWLQPADLSVGAPDLAYPASDDSPELNLAIALFGVPVFQEGSANVYSTFGSGLLAIASGAGSVATTGGFLNTALAFGDGSTASASGAGIMVMAVGDHATAGSGGLLPPIPIGLPTGDSAFAFGDHSMAGVFGGSYNSAVVVGNDSTATAGGLNSFFNSASVFGDHSTAAAGGDPAIDNSGSFDLAAVNGDNLDADATGGIFKIDLQPLFSSLGLTSGTADADGSWLADLFDGSWLHSL